MFGLDHNRDMLRIAGFNTSKDMTNLLSFCFCGVCDLQQIDTAKRKHEDSPQQFSPQLAACDVTEKFVNILAMPILLAPSRPLRCNPRSEFIGRD